MGEARAQRRTIKLLGSAVRARCGLCAHGRWGTGVVRPDPAGAQGAARGVAGLVAGLRWLLRGRAAAGGADCGAAAVGRRLEGGG